ncbi:MAG TPA: glycosyltransferase family 4 protein [Chitinophagaceae bacterium]|nr:glycosyltransferase family 4 protein [Chitinophagaceae bacterium]
MIKSIIILGPAHPFRSGGITTFNERLATEFQNQGYEVTIYNFSLQYPAFLFPGKSQYSTEPAPAHLKILQKVNSINPFNWIKVGNELKRIQPDLIVVRYWLPLMGPALGTILRKVKKNRHTKVIAIIDNVIPHEKRPGDKLFTQYFLKPCDAFITMSEKVMKDLKSIEPNKPAIQVAHPLYDNFGVAISKEEARKQLKIKNEELIILFFGFIRKYKGLDILLEAMSLLKSSIVHVKLLIAGEFYGDEKVYQQQIDELGIRDQLILKTYFITDSEVKNYFCAADVVIQPYRSATQSGVTPLAYHFEKPMIVTNVGALPDYVPHEKAGLVAEPRAASLAAAIERYFVLGEEYFLPQLREEKKKYSWKVLTDEIVKLAESSY